MKKRLFSLLLVAFLMPFALRAQTNAMFHQFVVENACETFTWDLNGVTYTNDTVVNYVSGDTLYVLDLTISHATTTVVPGVQDGGCTFSWGSEVYHTSGTYTQTFQTVNGCDSTVTITVHISGVGQADITKEACDSLIWRGRTFRSSVDSTLSVARDTTVTGSCDSLINIHFTIHPVGAAHYYDTVVACNFKQFKFYGDKKAFEVRNTMDTMKVFRNRTLQQCNDSSYHVHFTIHHSAYVTEQVVACDTFSWNRPYLLKSNNTIRDTTILYSRSVRDTLAVARDINTCDSFAVLNLTINKTPVVEIGGQYIVNPGENVTLFPICDQNNVTFSWNTSYNNTSMDHDTITLKAVNQNIDVELSAANKASGCTGHAFVTVLANVGIADVDNNINIYPNPTSDVINVLTDKAVKTIEVYNLMGQRMVKQDNGSSINVNALANGTYSLRVVLEDGSVITRNFVVTK